jgi:hypothetical protein
VGATMRVALVGTGLAHPLGAFLGSPSHRGGVDSAFAGGVASQEVADAVERSAAERRWVDLLPTPANGSPRQFGASGTAKSSQMAGSFG